MSAPALAHYSEALDEIYRLRMALAYEAQQLNELLVQSHSALSNARRSAVYEAMLRMRAAARGSAQHVYDETRTLPPAKLIEHHIPFTLTRTEWES